MILSCSLLGQMLIGLVVLKVYKGRKAMFFIWAMIFTLLFDSVVIYFRFEQNVDRISFYITTAAGLLSFMLQYVGAFIFLFEFGKVELLKKGRKVFALALSFSLLVQYLFFELVFYPITLLIHQSTICRAYFVQMIIISILSIISIIAIFPLAVQ